MFKVLLSKVVEVLCEKCLTKSLTYNNNSIEINFPCCNIQNFANGSVFQLRDSLIGSITKVAFHVTEPVSY